jgi:hypothetical protein
MSPVIIGGIALLALAFIFGIFTYIRRHKGMNVNSFTSRWIDLQKNCATRKTWPLAIIDADNLLDDALKARKYKGKTPGERLVAAQHELTANEAVWFGHKFRARIESEDVRKLKKKEVLDALLGFRQALKDLGVLKSD